MRKIITQICILFIISLAPLNAQIFIDQTNKFTQALDFINLFYVDSIDSQKLIDTAIINMLKSLDPHSSYLTAKEVKEMNESLQGNFEGIGVSFNILNDTIFVINTIHGGPSEKVGVMAGDKIVKIDGKNVAGIKISNNDVLTKLRGPKSTTVTISVLRKNVQELLDFTIIRDKIPINSVDASYMLDSETGYIKLNKFAQTTGNEFRQAMVKLHYKELKNLILDLTDNGGGYLEEAVELADQFLSDGKLIVYTQGVHKPRTNYYATKKGWFEKGKLVILIDEGSASASEILAGAIQDWDRGIIIGRRSFGKGLVQQRFPLQDGSELRLTVARYYTPSGRLIQKPYNKGSESYALDIINRYKKGEFIHKDSIHFPDSLKFYTLEKKHVVYGGGGIMPDYFVPLDTLSYSEYYRDIIRKNLLNRFVLNYIDQNRADIIEKYPDMQSFIKNFNDSLVFNGLIAFAEKNNLKPNTEQIKISKNVMFNLMKAYIASDIWDTNGYYEIINQNNEMIKQALEIIKHPEEKKKEMK